MRKYQMFELSFRGPALETDWADAEIHGQFSVNGKTASVEGFYDGNGVYKVRYLPLEEGLVKWRVWGAVSGEGEEQCGGTEGHGPVMTSGTHFTYSDGSRYCPVGTTVYALAHQEDALVRQTLESLKASPFNKVRMCVFPKHYEYNANEPPCYPFERNADGTWNTGRPNVAFWHRMERILTALQDMGVEADLILFHPYDRWGFSKMTQPENERYLRYLLCRLSAFSNIWWSLANEYDLLHWITAEDWQCFENLITRFDPVGHPLSNHNIYSYYDFSHPRVTHCCLQSNAMTLAGTYVQRYQKPVIFDEMRYEGNIPQTWGNLSGFELVNRFWTVYALGAYASHGETFLSDDDVLWWSKGGRLKGESVSRIAWLKKVIEMLPGPIDAAPDYLHQIFEEANRLGAEQVLSRIPEAYHVFARSVLAMPLEQQMAARLTNSVFSGCCGEEAYLTYLSRDCASSYQMRLPADKEYEIYVLDVWEMTCQRVGQGSGTVTVRLPGKEGIAVIAKRREN